QLPVQSGTGMLRKDHLFLFLMWGDYRHYEIQKFFQRVLGRVVKVLRSHERNQVLTPVLAGRATSTLPGTALQNSTNCRSSSREVFRSKLTRECRAGATGSTCF